MGGVTAVAGYGKPAASSRGSRRQEEIEGSKGRDVLHQGEVNDCVLGHVEWKLYARGEREASLGGGKGEA